MEKEKTLTWDDVFKRPLSYSSLKEFAVSPRHYIHYLKKPYTPATKAQKLGSLCEHLLIEDKPYEERFMVMPKINKRTNAGKELFQEFLTKAEGKTIVDEDDLATAKAVTALAKENPHIQKLLDNKTRTQKKLYWKEKVTWNGKEYKIPMIGFLDMEAVTENGIIACEVKTDRGVNVDDFTRIITNMGYHLQPAVYYKGYIKTEFRFPKMKWIFMNTSEPYGSMVIDFPQRDLEYSRAMIDGYLTKFVQCMEENRWDEDFNFWLTEGAEAFTYMMPFWARKAIQKYEVYDDE